ncbi:MAG TPA: (deoxy)nucleoside triphosphate pyrophosphohydrolase [Myxococcaceae bacterium]|nr:(deoxy)nucleoside triphosphate pyrophosphohydrolase [Myxococcaceae bacterium]
MSRRQIRVVGAMLEKEGGRYLITQRRPGASLPLLWEFPGGRVQEGEGDAEALARELKEEMGVEIRVGEQVMHLLHDYPDYEIDFRVFRCGLISPESDIQHLRVHDHRWVTLSEMNQYQFPAADARTLEKLLDLDH